MPAGLRGAVVWARRRDTVVWHSRDGDCGCRSTKGKGTRSEVVFGSSSGFVALGQAKGFVKAGKEDLKRQSGGMRVLFSDKGRL